jgi:hypothetical protein
MYKTRRRLKCLWSTSVTAVHHGTPPILIPRTSDLFPSNHPASVLTYGISYPSQCMYYRPVLRICRNSMPQITFNVQDEEMNERSGSDFKIDCYNKCQAPALCQWWLLFMLFELVTPHRSQYNTEGAETPSGHRNQSGYLIQCIFRATWRAEDHNEMI